MFTTLLATAFLMGLVGTPHCLVMCGAACAALGATSSSGPSAWAWHLGRGLSYAAAGAMMAAALGLADFFSQTAPVLRPLWMALHLVVLGVGLCMLVTGQQPLWMRKAWQALSASARPSRLQPVVLTASPAWAGRAAELGSRPVRKPVWLSLAWALWPCGLLQSALLLSSLANAPWQGAATMGAFALGSSLGIMGGLHAASMAWAKLSRPSTAAQSEQEVAYTAAAAMRAKDAKALQGVARLAGLVLVCGSAWALSHGLWGRAVGMCL